MNLGQLLPAIASVAGGAFGMPWLGPVVGAGMQAAGGMGGGGGGGPTQINQTTQQGPGGRPAPPPFDIRPNQQQPDPMTLGLLPLLLAHAQAQAQQGPR